jgi:pimeloyl-ACP methyl ester carboxylesterase
MSDPAPSTRPPPEPEPDRAPPAPLDALRVLAVQEKAMGDGLDHVELYTLDGLLTLLWHGPRDAHDVVLMCGGAMGGLLGPADGLYHDLGVTFAAAGIGTVRVGYRSPNDLDRCVLDLAAAADIAGRVGARRFVVVGHSFGGAVAINTAIALGRHAAGVVTLATQSAGCEHAELLDAPLLMLHGEADELLPPMASEMVRMIVGHGELDLLPGTGHLLKESAEPVRQRLTTWIPERFAAEESTS